MPILPFHATLVGDMFQYKIGKIIKELRNVFGIVHDILIVGYDADGKDFNRMLRWVMQICHKENFKLNKDICHFRCTQHSHIFGDIISGCSILLDLCKLHACIDMLSPTHKKELQSFLGIVNYFDKFSPAATEVYEPLWRFN